MRPTGTGSGTGAGSKGERWYDSQCWILAEPEGWAGATYLLFRHSCAHPDDWQAYAAFIPQGCDPGTLVGVADRRHIEHAFETAKQEVALDGYEVCNAVVWYWHTTLVLWALALLAVVREAELELTAPPKKESGDTQPDSLQTIA